MTLGQDHIGLNVDKEEDSTDVSVYGSMDMSEDQIGSALFLGLFTDRDNG